MKPFPYITWQSSTSEALFGNRLHVVSQRSELIIDAGFDIVDIVVTR